MCAVERGYAFHAFVHPYTRLKRAADCMFPWHEIIKTWSGNSSGFYYIYSGISVIFIQANKTCKRELALAHERVHAVAYKVYAEA